jgi:hypothetical protein
MHTNDTNPISSRPRRRVRRVLTALGVATIILTAGACSNSPGSDSSAGRPVGAAEQSTTAPSAKAQDRAACDLLTPELAATALPGAGAPTSDDNSVDQVRVTNCRYTDGDGQSLSLLLRHEPGQAGFVDSSINSLKTITYEGLKTDDVPGLGDAALFAPASGGQLNVFDGDDFLVFTGGSLDQLKPLAQSALAS